MTNATYALPVEGSGSAPTGATITVTLEEMPAIADSLTHASQRCAERPVPISSICAETMLFLGVNARARLASGQCTMLAAGMGQSATELMATAVAVRLAHSAYLQVENMVAGWFESLGIAQDGKLPDGLTARTHIRGALAGDPDEVRYLIRLTLPELGYYSASIAMPYSPLAAAVLFGATAYLDARLNPEIARRRVAERLSRITGIPVKIIEKFIGRATLSLKRENTWRDVGNTAHNVRTASADEYGVAAHRGEKNQLSVGSSSERLQAAAKAQDQEFERSQQDPTKGERGAVMVTVMYEEGHEGDPAYALYVVSIPGTNFDSWGGAPMDPAGAVRETLGEDTTRNPAYRMVLQALRDAGAPQGARVYLEGFSQGAMIAYNMANSFEVAKEINIIGIYAQGAPLRGLPAKRRDFAVDYVEGEGDIVPNSAVRPEGGWRPDDRDTSITVQNSVHHGEKYREALDREGYSNAAPGGIRAAMDGKEYVLGEQKVTSGSAMPDGYSLAERRDVTISRIGIYSRQAYKSGVRFDEKGVDEAIEHGTGGMVKGVQDAKDKGERIQKAAQDTWESAERRLPHPGPKPSQEPGSPKPTWPEMPAPQTPKTSLLQGYDPQNVPPGINLPVDLSGPEPATIKLPARIEPEGLLPPADLLPPDLLPEPAGSQANIGKVINQPTIDDLQLPKIGSALGDPLLGPRQGGDYEGGESLTPDLPDLKPVPMPVAPAEDIDPGFHTPIPPEETDPGLIHPAPEPRRAVTVEREPAFA